MVGAVAGVGLTGVALGDLYLGNLYVELPSETREWGRKTLKNSSDALARRYPALRTAANDQGATVEQVLFDTVFTHLIPAQLSLAALTLRGDSAVNVAVRLSGDARPNWPLPKGVALVAKANWRLTFQNGDVNTKPVLQVLSFHDGPSGGPRDFEANLNVTCLQKPRLEAGFRWERNALTASLAQALPPISEITQEKLKDWNDFLEWKRRLVNASRDGLRYTSRTMSGDKRSVIFTAVGESEESLKRTISSLSRSTVLAAFGPSVSEDEWTFRLPDGEREPRGSEIGSLNKGRPRFEGADVPVDGCPWNQPVTAGISFALSDDALARIEQSADLDVAVERAMQGLPAAGFIVPSAVQDLSQIDRQGRALRDLSDQGGHSPYLARYIFDAAEARKPSDLTPVDRWFNPRLNDAQRLAVQKVLSAPDICLIQGPPGTGKTTVIAESIAQVVERNETVLLASQTHTAVDNALSRLPLLPSIRAVRLTRNETRLSEEGKEFLNERALGRYYKSIAEFIVSRREGAEAEARFAAQFSGFEGAATELVSDLERAENHVSELTSDVQLAVDGYLEFVTELNTANVKIPNLDGASQDLSRLSGLDAWLTDLGVALPRIKIQMESLLDERPSTAASPGGGMRSGLEQQLATVLERMKDDASAVTEYQRLQTALTELDASDPHDAGFANPLLTYFPDAESLLEAEGNAFLAMLRKKKRVRTVREVLRRVDYAEGVLPRLNKARKVRGERQDSLSRGEAQLEFSRGAAYDYFSGQASQFLSRELPRDPRSSGVLRELLDAAVAGQFERVSKARQMASDQEVWKDIQDDWVADLMQDGIAELDWQAIGDDWLAECNVVGITCNENPKTLEEAGLSSFDLAIVDEVSKATPLELLLPLMRARRSALVGDDRQLPPMFREGQDAEGLADETDEGVPEEQALTPENMRKYEKFVTASLFRNHFERAGESIKQRLTVQHRMHPDIMDSINTFYEGQLTSGIVNPDEVRAHGLTVTGRGDLPVISPQQHMVWVDTTRDDRGNLWSEPAQGSGQERTNILEARLIVRMLRNIDDALVSGPLRGDRLKEIGIVSMYQAQVRCIRQEINKQIKDRPFKAISYELNTVVKYQGKEKPIILVSMVRNFGPKASSRRRSSRANVARFEYINVAFSRAQELLVVFGARDTFAPYQVELPPMDATGAPRVADVYKEITDAVERKGALKQASALGELPSLEGKESTR